MKSTHRQVLRNASPCWATRRNGFLSKAPVLTAETWQIPHFYNVDGGCSRVRRTISTCLARGLKLDHDTPLRCRIAASCYEATTTNHPASHIRLHLIPRDLKNRRSFSNLSSSTGHVRVQHVKLSAPAPRRLFNPWLRWAFYLSTATLLLSLWDTGRSDEDNSSEEKMDEETDTSKPQKTLGSKIAEAKSNGKQGSDVEVDVDDVLMFIPFGWPRRKPPVLYKGTDEDWQDFCKFGKDREKIGKAKYQAAHFVETLVRMNPNLAKALGEPVKCTKYWLDIEFPTEYSGGFEVSGFVIAEDVIAWASREYDDRFFEQIARILDPRPVIKAFWNITHTIFSGKESLTMKTMSNEQFPMSVPGVPDLNSTPNLKHDARKPFVQWLGANRHAPTPQGCVIISGRIDVTGTHYLATFDFFGYYSPKHDAWNNVPVVQLQTIRPLKVSPRGTKKK